MLTLEFTTLQRKSGVFGLIKNWAEYVETTDNPPCRIKLNYLNLTEDDLVGGKKSKHPIPARARTLLMVDDKKILLDGQDHNKISSGLSSVLGEQDYDLVVKMQFRPSNYEDCPIKVVPFTYYTVNHDLCMDRRDKVREFKHSLMWAGTCTGSPQRQLVKSYLRENGKYAWYNQVGLDKYFDKIVDSVAGMIVQGVGFFCHRDIEFMAVGTPFASKYYENITHNPIIPGYHYYTLGNGWDDISINDLVKYYLNYFEPNGNLRVFTAEEQELHDEIAHNSMQWYDDNASPAASLRLLIEILQINGLA